MYESAQEPRPLAGAGAARVQSTWIAVYGLRTSYTFCAGFLPWVGA